VRYVRFCAAAFVWANGRSHAVVANDCWQTQHLRSSPEDDEVSDDRREEVSGAVVPVDDDGRVGEIDLADPWELLARDQGLLVQWQSLPEPVGSSWGPTLSAGSELAKQLAAIATSAGAPAAIRNGAALFTLELPTGTTLRNLVPAIGGGFRGMVRTGGSGAIAGHGRLVPVGGAAAGVGAGIALGPLVALMALSVNGHEGRRGITSTGRFSGDVTRTTQPAWRLTASGDRRSPTGPYDPHSRSARSAWTPTDGPTTGASGPTARGPWRRCGVSNAGSPTAISRPLA
jgi:hypothetical protein